MFFGRKNDEGILALKALGIPTGQGWWVRYPRRAIEEISKMAEGSNAHLDFRGSKMVFEEWITTNLGTDCFISLEADGFPHKMPKAFVKQPAIKTRKHLWSDDSLCLMEPSSYGSGTSILQFRNLAAAWCFCYEVYINTGNWPAAEH